MTAQPTVFTIGHSTHTREHFIALLREQGVTAICDVRSAPFSRTNPQFNRDALRSFLRTRGIVYVFLGKELGARTDDPSCYERGKVQYERLASTEVFKAGLGRILRGVERYRLALMCAEKEPLECHRTILVARQLLRFGIDIQHIHSDGRVENHEDAMLRLVRILRLSERHMFRSPHELLDDAYRLQGKRIAYSSNEIDDETGKAAAG